MSFGLTSEGFVLKRLADVKEEMENDARAVFGDSADLNGKRPLGQFIGIQAERISQLWELLKTIYDNSNPESATGKSLDDQVAFNAIIRRAATFSTVELTLFGDEATVIPAGSEVSVDGASASVFSTDEEATIAAGINEIQSISFDVEPVGGSFTLVFDGQATAAINFDDTAAEIKTALEDLSNLESVSVLGDFYEGFTVEFTGADGKKDQALLTVGSNTLSSDGVAVGDVVVSIATETAGSVPKVTVDATATTAGPVSAPSGSLTVIEDSVSGWDSVTNLLDATEGLDEETDAELKLRRRQQIAIAAATTPNAIRSELLELEGVLAAAVFVNNTYETVDSIPPKSVRIVLRGGEPEVVAPAIFDAVAAGIGTYGAESYTITDESGFDQIIQWDYATEIEIYLEIDLTTDSDFPVNGSTLIRDAVIAFGDDLNSGDDVIVNPYLMGVLDGVDGITDATIRIGTSASPTLDDNITIEPDEIAIFDTSRITITVA